MTTRTKHEAPRTETPAIGAAAAPNGTFELTPRITGEQVWRAISRASFAVLGFSTPTGDPRCTGVVYQVSDGRLYVAVAPDSWKARHIAGSGRVAVTVPVRRGGMLSLIAPIPPATVSFHGAAIVHPAGSQRARSLATKLGSLLPPDRRDSCAIIEILPEGEFLTYGLGVSLTKMRDPEASLAHVAVTPAAQGIPDAGTARSAA
jgi:hypothetical protein